MGQRPLETRDEDFRGVASRVGVFSLGGRGRSMVWEEYMQ